MKRTDKGEWCHASCALWIPETAFDDVKLMEPVINVEVRVQNAWELVWIAG